MIRQYITSVCSVESLIAAKTISHSFLEDTRRDLAARGVLFDRRGEVVHYTGNYTSGNLDTIEEYRVLHHADTLIAMQLGRLLCKTQKIEKHNVRKHALIIVHYVLKKCHAPEA
jgi:hypothetical protein